MRYERKRTSSLSPASSESQATGMPLSVGFPVPAPALVTCLLTACGEAASLADEGERGSRLQPGKPGRGVHGQDLLLPVLPIDQGLALDRGSHGGLLSAVAQLLIDPVTGHAHGDTSV